MHSDKEKTYNNKKVKKKKRDKNQNQETTIYGAWSQQASTAKAHPIQVDDSQRVWWTSSRLVCSAMKNPSGTMKTWQPVSLVTCVANKQSWPRHVDISALVLLSMLQRMCANVAYASVIASMIVWMHKNQLFFFLQINTTVPRPYNLTPSFTTLTSLHCNSFPACFFESGKMPSCTGTASEFCFFLLFQLGEL